MTPSKHRYGWRFAYDPSYAREHIATATYRRLFAAEYLQYIRYTDGKISYDQARFNNDWDIIHRECMHWRRITLESGGRELCHLRREGEMMQQLKKYSEEEAFRPLDTVVCQ